MVGRYNGL